MRYACLIYYDPKELFGGAPEANAALAECEGHDEVLKKTGNFVLGEALEMPESAITVRMRDGRMSTTDGPFMESKEMLGGIVVIDAERPQRSRASRQRPSAGRDRRGGGAAGGRFQRAAPGAMTGAAAAAIERLYRGERRRVLATLIRLLGSFDAAEDALHDAFAAGRGSWPRDGVPPNPYAWLVSTGRFRTIDRWRRRARLAAALPELARLAETEGEVAETAPDPRRRAAADLHLLPPGAAARRADRPHPARGRRADHRGDRARLPHPAGDHRPADRARQGEDP